MRFGLDENKNVGLLFASETDEFSDQSVVFTVPLVDEPRHPFALMDYFQQQSFYFPALLDQEYLEIEAKVDFPALIFTVPKTDFTISFELDLDPFYYFELWQDLSPYPPSMFPNRRRKLKYVGKDSKLVPANRGFVPLLPLDVFEMDELYIKHKGVFVGLTPNFGEQASLV